MEQVEEQRRLEKEKSEESSKPVRTFADRIKSNANNTVHSTNTFGSLDKDDDDDGNWRKGGATTTLKPIVEETPVLPKTGIETKLEENDEDEFKTLDQVKKEEKKEKRTFLDKMKDKNKVEIVNPNYNSLIINKENKEEKEQTPVQNNANSNWRSTLKEQTPISSVSALKKTEVNEEEADLPERIRTLKGYAKKIAIKKWREENPLSNLQSKPKADEKSLENLSGLALSIQKKKLDQQIAEEQEREALLLKAKKEKEEKEEKERKEREKIERKEKEDKKRKDSEEKRKKSEEMAMQKAQMEFSPS